MRRKIVKQGASTLMISLPSKWTKKYNLRKGDEIEIEEEDKTLVVSTSKRFAVDKKQIDITDYPKHLIDRFLLSAYNRGYDEIELFFDNRATEIKDKQGNVKQIKTIEVIQETVNRLIGVEIIDQSEKRYIIKDLSGESEEKFGNALRRIFLLIISMGDDCLEYAGQANYESLQTMSTRHDNINRFVNYCLRLLSKRGHKNFRDTQLYYYLICELEEITDVYKYIAKEILLNKSKPGKNTLQLFKETNELFRDFYEYFYEFKKEKVLEISNKRDELFFKINKLNEKSDKTDILMMSRLAVIIFVVMDLVEARVTMSL